MLRLLVAVVLFCCLGGCQAKPPLAPLPPDGTVLAFGDSLTYGTGAGSGESYPAVLGGLIGRRVVNAGVPGEVSADGAARLPELLDREKPAILLLCHGGNDLLQKLDHGRLKGNLRQMAEAARTRGVSVVLLAVPEPGLSLTPPALYGELAEELNLPIERKILPKVLGRGSLKSDYIHPNAAGYRQVAVALADLLKRHGAVGK